MVPSVLVDQIHLQQVKGEIFIQQGTRRFAEVGHLIETLSTLLLKLRDLFCTEGLFTILLEERN